MQSLHTNKVGGKIMGEDKGYKDTKEYICTGCGKTIILTKFASQKTCRCDECKANNVPTNPDIVAKALEKNPPKERKKAEGGATKICKCINCGEDVEVTKFMSASKVLCNKCKGVSDSSNTSHRVSMVVDKSKLSKINMPPIEEYEMNGGMIANKRLQKVVCPACGHEYMKPIMIIDWSPFGLVIQYQCPDCYTSINLSEQTREPIKIHTPAIQFDYTGRQVREISTSLAESSRLANALCILIEKCEQCNINIDDVFANFSETIPPYKWLNDRPVEKGFVIPEEDIWIHTVHQAYELLKNAERVDGEDDKYVKISDTLATQIADKLNELLGGKK